MMNAALDRWGIASSSVYQNHINNANKENKDDGIKTDNAKDGDNEDSKKNNRQPLSQKKQEQQQQLPKSLDSKVSKKESPKKQKNKKSKSSDSKSSYSDSSSSGSRRQSGPVEKLLGDEEDDVPPLLVHSVEEMNEVSTIAGDTFAGIEMDPNVAEAVPPYNGNSPNYSAYGVQPLPLPPGAAQLDTDNMFTPTYSVLQQQGKKTLSRVFHDVNLETDDSSTLPESPENNDENAYGDVEKGKRKGFFSSQKKKRRPIKADKSFSLDEFDDEKDQSALDKEMPISPRRRRLRCIMCTGCFLAFFLLVGIAALGYTLYAIRHEDDGALSLFTREFWENAGDKLAFWKKDEEEQPIFEEDPIETVGTVAPTDYSTSHHTSWSSTGTSTYVPTSIETEIQLSPEMQMIRSIVLSAAEDRGISGIDEGAFQNETSAQYTALEWVSLDPSLDEYSEEKILQRYALGCFYTSLLGDEDSNATNIDETKNFDAVRNTWMGDGDECIDWAYTETKPNQKGPCNEAGQIRSIHLEDAGLTGTLTPEIALLSDSLESLFLTKNKIHGTIPPEFGQLTALQRLQLSRNKLEGTVNGPEFLAPLVELEIIGLGGNKLSGPLPEELASMPSMMYINIPYNKFTGTIPTTWDANTTKLFHLSLGFNDLTGTIPDELTSIESLKNLLLTGNELVGSVTESVCVGTGSFFNDETTTYNGMKMTVDCDSVHCTCCGCNGVTPPPFVIDEIISNTTVDGDDLEASSSNVTTVVEDVSSNATTIVEDVSSNATTIVEDGTEPVAETFGPEPQVENSATTDVTTEAPIASIPEDPEENALGTFPFVDDEAFDEAMEVLNGALPAAQATERYGCQKVDVGFPCYNSGWSIDFELSNVDCATPQRRAPPTTTDYDLVSIVRFEGDIAGPSKVGTLKSLDDSLFWATSCGLTECDGVLANGQVYYRNTYPKQTAPLSPPWWPIAPNNMMQVQWLRVAESGTAIVLAESQPFLVTNRCP